jgi:hypothetical protein
MRSHSISLKYVVSIIYRTTKWRTQLVLLENAPRLERSLAHLCPRSGCQNYPQALLSHALPRPIYVNTKNSFPPSVSTGTNSSLNATRRFFTTIRVTPHRRAHRSLRSFLPNRAQARHAGLPGFGGQRASRRLRSRPCRRQLIPRTCVIFKRAKSIELH